MWSPEAAEYVESRFATRARRQRTPMQPWVSRQGLHHARKRPVRVGGRGPGAPRPDAEAARRRGGGRPASRAHPGRERRRDLLPRGRPPAGGRVRPALLAPRGRPRAQPRSGAPSAPAGGGRGIHLSARRAGRGGGRAALPRARLRHPGRRPPRRWPRPLRLPLRAPGEAGEPAWRTWYPAFPPVICVLAGASRVVLERRRDTAIALLRSVWGCTNSIGRGGEPRRSLLATPSCGSAS
jgi:hypothetical protein